MKIITVDAGKYRTKGMCDIKKSSIRTKLEEIDNAIYNDGSNTHHVIWTNKNYLLGEGAKADPNSYDTSKQKLNHKLSIYTTCADLLEEPDEIALVVLSPLSTFTHKTDREEFRQYILDDGIIQFELDGEPKQLILKDVTVFAEGCGTAFSNPNKFKNNITGIIDIGGLNCNGIVMDNMSPVLGTEFTINAGSYMIMEKIRKELNKELKANIQDYQMEMIIRNGYYNYNKDVSTEIIQSILSDHFKEIIKIMKANNWDVKGLDIVCTGGGSLNLGLNNISKFIPHAQIANDPVWDNCRGGQIVGEMIYG